MASSQSIIRTRRTSSPILDPIDQRRKRRLEEREDEILLSHHSPLLRDLGFNFVSPSQQLSLCTLVSRFTHENFALEMLGLLFYYFDGMVKVIKKQMKTKKNIGRRVISRHMPIFIYIKIFQPFALSVLGLPSSPAQSVPFDWKAKPKSSFVVELRTMEEVRMFFIAFGYPSVIKVESEGDTLGFDLVEPIRFSYKTNRWICSFRVQGISEVGTYFKR